MATNYYYAEALFDLTSYINSPSLSDVVLVSEDKQTFHAHRIVLCAQSVVLKTMLDSDVWAESNNKEVCIIYFSHNSCSSTAQV